MKISNFKTLKYTRNFYNFLADFEMTKVVSFAEDNDSMYPIYLIAGLLTFLKHKEPFGINGVFGSV